jgi:acetyltransferase
VALKVDSPDILHKTEADVVRLNLRDAQVRTAYAEILASAKTYLSALPHDGGGLGGGDAATGNPSPPSPLMPEGRGGGEFAAANPIAPQAQIIGVSVQEMVGEGVEVIIGVNCDPQLGPVLLFGSGGVIVEVYNDRSLRRCPITRSEAQAMIAEVKGARLLQGFRGRPAADLEALADTLVRVSHLAMHLEGDLAELDIKSADGAAVRSESEGDRRSRRLSRCIAVKT